MPAIHLPNLTDLTGWYNVLDYGIKGDNSTDDTVALQALITLVATGGGGTIYFPAGTRYVIGGALQETSRGNAQLLLPAVMVDATTRPYPVRLVGGLSPVPVGSTIGTLLAATRGPIIKSTLSSGTGALLGGWGPSGSFEDFTFLTVYIENITFDMAANPTNSAVDLSHVVSADFNNVMVQSGGLIAAQDFTEPTTSTSYGVKLPAINNGAYNRLNNLSIFGFYNGLKASEHTDADTVQIWACKYGLEMAAANHASHFRRLGIFHCANGIRFTGVHYAIFDQVDIEHKNPAIPSAMWMDPVYDIVDASNYGYGTLTYHVVKAWVGIDQNFIKQGGGHLVCKRLGAEHIGLAVEDTFTDTDAVSLASHTIGPVNTSGAAWTVHAGAMKVLSNKVGTFATSVSSLNYATVDLGVSDAVVSADLTYDSNAGRSISLMLRYTDVNNWIGAFLYNGTFIIHKNVASSGTTIATTSPTLVNGSTYHVEVVCSGANISATLDGTTTISSNAAPFTTITRFGLRAATVDVEFTAGNLAADNFQAYSL